MAIAMVVAMLMACVCTTAVAGGRRGGEGGGGAGKEVRYDGRALVLNGTRRVLFSGEMHYTRSTPEVIVQQGFGYISQSFHPHYLIMV